jgi:C4-dicarboxylate transporter DctQ subunit
MQHQLSLLDKGYRFIKIVDNLIGFVGRTLSAICLIVVLISIFAQVFCRFLLGFSLTWSEEVGRYLLVWISFTGFGVLVKEKKMMSIMFMVDLLPGKLKITAKILADLLSIMFMIIVCYYGFLLVELTMIQVTVVTEIPMGYVYLVIPIGAAFYVIHSIVGHLDRLKGMDRQC